MDTIAGMTEIGAMTAMVIVIVIETDVTIVVDMTVVDEGNFF